MAAVLATACSSNALPKLAANDVILAFGDSLTYGTGASEAESYPAVLAGLIGRKVIREGVPGETTEEGLRRLPAVLDEHKPALLLLCLGGNDLLRRIDETAIAANLRAMLVIAKQAGIPVVLIGVPRPALFAGPPPLYAALADEFDVPYDDDVVEDVLYANSMKADPIHPNAAGYRKIAEEIAELLGDAGAV